MEKTTRRRMLLGVPVALAGLAAITFRRNPHAEDTPDEVTIMQFGDTGAKLGPARVKRITRSDAEWWGLLTPQQYYVTRRRNTDPPFSGTYYQTHDRGLFRCICCTNAVFSSEAKYDSGTGWPSFWTPIAPENIRTHAEPGVSLDSGIEVLCTRCDAHLGHVFNHGPAPTHLRYCINESSLRFVNRAV